LRALGNQYPLLPNSELDGDMVAALTEVDNVGMAMMANNAIAAINFFMTYLLLLCGRSAFRFVDRCIFSIIER
jgi:hypothetical protein